MAKEENRPEVDAKTDKTILQATKWWSNMGLELFMFLFKFGSTLESTANGNLFLDRVCRVNMNETEEVCGNMTAYQDVLNRVQAQSNNMGFYILLIEMIPGAFYAMFAGTWSDKYGRKPLMYCSLIGIIIHDILNLLFVYYDHLPLEYSMITYVPVSLTGGLISLMGMVYSLTSDKTNVAKRTIKYAILEASIFLASPIAGVIAGQIYKYYGYLPVYSSTLIFHLVCLLILIFLLTETNRGPSSFRDKIDDFFKLDSVKDNFRTCMKKRPNSGRAQVLLLLFSGCFLLINNTALSALNYYYTNKVFGWLLPHYTIVSTTFSIVTMVVMVTALTVSGRFLKLTDATLGLVGSLSMAAQCITRAFSYEPWIFYLSFVCGIFSGMGPLSFRSKLSKTVQGDESGKLFAVLSILESLAPTPSTLLFTQIYNYTLDTFPGLVFLVAAVNLIFPAAVFIWLMRLPQTPNFEKLENDVPSSQPNLEPEPEKETGLSMQPVNNVSRG